MRRFEAAFDAAGVEGEMDLIGQLGSPTKTAIALSRGYEPGRLPEEFRIPAVKPAAAAAKPAVPAAPEELWQSMPELELPGMEGEEETEKPAEEPPAPAEKKRPASREPRESEPPAVPAAEPRTVIERTMPLGLGIPLFILVFGALGLPLGALCLAVSLLLLVPGCAVLFGAYLVFVGGLWSTGFMADAVLLFGLAMVVLAVGLLLLWLGLWLAVNLFTVYGRGVGWIAGELLGRKVQENA